VRQLPLKGHCRKESEKAAGLWMDVRRIARGHKHTQCKIGLTKKGNKLNLGPAVAVLAQVRCL